MPLLDRKPVSYLLYPCPSVPQLRLLSFGVPHPRRRGKRQRRIRTHPPNVRFQIPATRRNRRHPPHHPHPRTLHSRLESEFTLAPPPSLPAAARKGTLQAKSKPRRF